ncbi:dipeptide ABC transporter ATP-binding protein [Leucobacter sp. W1153]|uniref:dipeptide ABC transporter ATP-binding protein n=1 Tax=Leucobacter sp. W1153 TaxID=3439064 RepID=UPI003F3C231C
MSEERGLVVDRLAVTGPAGTIVDPVSFTVPPGRTLAIIGESGSGKTMTARALTGLLPSGVSATGRFAVDGDALDLPADPGAWHRVRGRRIVLLMQDPFTSLSPVHRCGDQIALTIRARIAFERGADRAAAVRRDRTVRGVVQAEVVQRLAEVNLAAEVARAYPSALSGGMRQRVAIAAALAAKPRVLIADEPTTALDASNQGEVLDLLLSLQRRHDMSLILVSHDLGLVSGRADEVLVMRHGEVVERGRADHVLVDPQHEYTRKLLEANPSIHDVVGSTAVSTASASPEPLLVAEGIAKRYGTTQALSGVDVDVRAGEVVAVVGESGSGKSTLARCLAGLDAPDAGNVRLGGEVLPPNRRGRTPDQMQIVFQDPYSTLNPVFTVEQTLREALRVAGRPADDLTELLETVDLGPEFAGRRPSQLSGGQRQRVAIARALAPRPRVLICDESVSALDVSVQAQILDLIVRLRDELQLAVLFITHDLGVVARVADRVLVLRRGEAVERGATFEVLTRPQHEYTQTLVAAARDDSIARANGAEYPQPSPHQSQTGSQP